MFFEVHGDAKGSVIDFVIYREGCKFGEACRILGDHKPILHKQIIKPEPVKPLNHDEIAETWKNLAPYEGGYLQRRGLKADTIRLFASQIRLDRYGNTCFRHNGKQGISGWEKKNFNGFTGFCAGGKKALFQCAIGKWEVPPYIIVCESAIDAMSYQQLTNRPGLYISFAGGLSPVQERELTELLQSYPASHVTAATDNDPQGEKYAGIIHAIRPDATRARPQLKDWNEVVMNRDIGRSR